MSVLFHSSHHTDVCGYVNTDIGSKAEALKVAQHYEGPELSEEQNMTRGKRIYNRITIKGKTLIDAKELTTELENRGIFRCEQHIRRLARLKTVEAYKHRDRYYYDLESMLTYLTLGIPRTSKVSDWL